MSQHREWFTICAESSALREESIRRTWWELYTIDALFAGFQYERAVRVNDVVADMLLPVEDSAYASGFPTKSILGMQHLRHRVFLDGSLLSSYALRIEAAWKLNRVLVANDSGGTVNVPSMRSLDGFLSSWFASLPETEAEVIASDGACDEVLFQAHAIVSMANIHLHMPRSNVFNLGMKTDIECVKHSRPSTASLSPTMHATKATNAAEQLAKLASTTLDQHDHTPLFNCSLMLIAIIHLSAVAGQVGKLSDSDTDRLSQALALLKSASRTWPIAAMGYTQLKSFASFVSGTTPVETSTVHEPSTSATDLQACCDSGQYQPELASLANSYILDRPE
ncbi:hypothetical protein ANO11243_018340 [Dothideomycetidae sp. 11243]|nr:hypothetical protein ANO11243_018340 [fungal sp. No.11243]